jgi:quinoprotein dehydrogenase-associated probable ABC transporter substrate-binding protein
MMRGARLCLSLIVTAAAGLLSVGPGLADEPAAAAAPAGPTGTAKKLEALRICGDPGNMPLSNEKGEGFENKIADALAAALDTKVIYFWRPYIERGMTRQTFDSNDCDVLMDMPADYESLLTTFPIYRSTYVLAYRADRGIKIKNLDDPALKKLKIGVYETSALREALANHGIKNNVVVHVLSHDADLVPDHQPWVQVQQVVDGKLDIAAVWGPFAGWIKSMQGAPLVIQPTNLMDDAVPMEFDMAIGTRRSDTALKQALESALRAKKDVIEKILADYGVPLVQCKPCLVSGDLPAHGPYPERALQSQDRPSASTASRISTQRVAQWLAEGADVNQELSNAVLAVDTDRVKFLLSRGADINKLDLQGYAPLHTAARGGNTEMLALLLNRKADPNVRDGNGWTPLLHTVLRNRLDAMKLLLSHGADIEAASPDGYSSLQVAIEEGKYAIAKVLIDDGAAVNAKGGAEQVAPLMVAASIAPPRLPGDAPAGPPSPLDIAKDLIAKGANVNAVTSKGVTPLMIAAAHDNGPMIMLLIQSGSDLAKKSNEGQTALDIARENGNEQALKTISAAMQKSAPN